MTYREARLQFKQVLLSDHWYTDLIMCRLARSQFDMSRNNRCLKRSGKGETNHAGVSALELLPTRPRQFFQFCAVRNLSRTCELD